MSIGFTLGYTFVVVLLIIVAFGFVFDLNDTRLRAAFARMLRAWAGAATHWEWS